MIGFDKAIGGRTMDDNETFSGRVKSGVVVGVVVGLLTSAIIGLALLVWDSMSMGGLLRAMGAVTAPVKVCRFVHFNYAWADSVVMPPNSSSEACRTWARSIVAADNYRWQLGCIREDTSSWGDQRLGSEPASKPEPNFCGW